MPTSEKKIIFFLLEHFSTVVQQLITIEEVSNSLVLLAVAHEFQPSTGTYFFLKVRVHCHDSKKQYTVYLLLKFISGDRTPTD